MENEKSSEGQENRDEGQVRKNVQLPVVLKLKKPLITDEGEITELKITREPVARDWLGFNISAPDVLSFMKVGSSLTGVSLPYLKQLTTRDMLRLQEAVADFLVTD